MKFPFQKSLYHRLILIMFVFLILPSLIVTIAFYQKILADGELNYHSNIELIAMQAHAQRERHIENMRTISDRIASSKELTGFLLTGYSPKSWSYYANEITQMVTGGLNYENAYLPKIYYANTTIPRGFQTFYLFSDIDSITAVSDFLQSDEVDKWVTPEEGEDYPPSVFTPFRGHYTYLRKVHLQGELIYLLTLSLSRETMDEFLYEDYQTITDINHEIFRTEKNIYVNYSSQYLPYEMIGENSLFLKRGGHIIDVSFPNFPQKITYFWPPNPQKKYLIYGIVLFSLFGIVAIIVVIYFIHKIFKNIFRCIQSFDHSVKSGEYSKLMIEGNDEISNIKIAFNSLIGKIQNLMQLTAQQSSIVKESQLKALQQQINPHFMYNTLEAFSYKMELYGHYEEADAMTAFSSMLRYNIASGGRYATIRDELEQVQSYISIQRIKYADITFDVDIPHQLYDTETPRLCLQPFIENSFTHGYCGKPMRILLSCVDLGDHVLIQVCDNGRGISQPELEQINEAMILNKYPDDTAGIGLININTRLKLFYSETYSVHLESEEGKWTLVTFRIPQ